MCQYPSFLYKIKIVEPLSEIQSIKKNNYLHWRSYTFLVSSSSSLLLSSAVFFITTPFASFIRTLYTISIRILKPFRRASVIFLYVLRYGLQCYYKLINFYDIIFFFDNINHKWYQIVILFYYRRRRRRCVYIYNNIITTTTENFIHERDDERFFPFTSSCTANVKCCLAHDHVRSQLGRMLRILSLIFRLDTHTRQKNNFRIDLYSTPWKIRSQNNLNEFCVFVQRMRAFQLAPLYSTTPYCWYDFPSVLLLNIRRTRLSDNIYLCAYKKKQFIYPFQVYDAYNMTIKQRTHFSYILTIYYYYGFPSIYYYEYFLFLLLFLSFYFPLFFFLLLLFITVTVLAIFALCYDNRDSLVWVLNGMARPKNWLRKKKYIHS